MVKLRLKRYGKKREPSYRIVAIDGRARREGRPLQELGYYNPRTKETTLETADLLKWLRHGAQPTETVAGILRKAGVFEMLKAGSDEGVARVRIPAIAKPTPAGTVAVVEPEVEVAEAAPETEAPAEKEGAEDPTEA